MNISLNPAFSQDLPPIEYTQKKQDRYDSNLYAPMDEKTQRIRNKLEKRLNAMDEKMTQERLEQTKQKIGLWLERHSSERVTVKKDSLHLFTGGKNAAPISKKINEIRERLKAGFNEATSSQSNLKGRVKVSP